MPCSKKDLCSACALCPWNFLYFDEHGGTQKAKTTVCSSMPSIPRLMPGRDRPWCCCCCCCCDDEDGGDGEDYDSIPRGRFISQEKRKMGRQEFYKLSKEGFECQMGARLIRILLQVANTPPELTEKGLAQVSNLPRAMAQRGLGVLRTRVLTRRVSGLLLPWPLPVCCQLHPLTPPFLARPDLCTHSD